MLILISKNKFGSEEILLSKNTMLSFLTTKSKQSKKCVCTHF